MPLPLRNDNHVAEANDLLIGRYKNTQVVAGILRAYAERLAEIESDFWSLIDGVQLVNHPMVGGPWDVLDKLGALVGEPRNGRGDADYLAAIKIRIRVNKSNGLDNDIMAVASLVVTVAAYYKWPPAAWEVDTFTATASAIAALKADLGKAASAATRGQVRYGTAAASAYVTWSSVSGGAGGVPFGSVYGGASTAEWAALEDV